MKLDLHVHTSYSIDSIISPKDLALKSHRLGIVPAVTDHNNMKAHQELQKLGAVFIPGEEIKTDRGDVIGLYLTEPVARNISFAEAIDLIHGQGGLVYLPHMFDRTRSGCGDPGKLKDRIDILEVFNARALESSSNRKAYVYAEENRIVPAVGSDSHFLFEFGATYNKVPDFDLDSPRQLLRALPKASHVMKRAPFYVRGTTSVVKLIKSLL